MAMGTLADLEDQEPIPGKESPFAIHLKVSGMLCPQLRRQTVSSIIKMSRDSCCCIPFSFKAVNSAKKYYNNEHIYPFMYLAGYHYRHREVREALGSWAEAASVMQE